MPNQSVLCPRIVQLFISLPGWLRKTSNEVATEKPPLIAFLPLGQYAEMIKSWSAPAAPVRAVTSGARMPLGPAGPCGPVAPGAPAGPTGPAGPVAPAGPVSPFGPAGPATPASPFGPAGPAAPMSPFGPGAP